MVRRTVMIRLLPWRGLTTSLSTCRPALSLLGRRTTANGAFLAIRRRLPSSLKVTERGVPRRARRVTRCVLVFSPNVSLVAPRRPVRARTGVRRGAHGSTDTTGAMAVGIGPGAPLGDGPGMSRGLVGDGSGTTVGAGGAGPGAGAGGGGVTGGGGGGRAGTAVVAREVAVVVPFALVALTATRSVAPASAVPSTA